MECRARVGGSSCRSPGTVGELMHARASTPPQEAVCRHSQSTAGSHPQAATERRLRLCMQLGRTWRRVRRCRCRSAGCGRRSLRTRWSCTMSKRQREQRAHIGRCHLPHSIYLALELPLERIRCRRAPMPSASRDGQGRTYKAGVEFTPSAAKEEGAGGEE
jgi:hypothetical protein